MYCYFIKFFWCLRFLLYAPFFGKFSFPGYLGKPLFISRFRNINFGKRVRIYPHSRFELIDENSKVSIGNNVSIGHNLHIVSLEHVIIKSSTLISANVFISDVSHTYAIPGVPINDQKLVQKDTIVGKNCFIGYGVVLDYGTVLGNNCVVGANSVLRSQHYPDYSVIVGAPARIIKRFNNNTRKWMKTDQSGKFL